MCHNFQHWEKLRVNITGFYCCLHSIKKTRQLFSQPESEYFAHIHELQHLYLTERGGGGPAFRRKADILHFKPDLDPAFGNASNQDPYPTQELMLL
jgi:hypothetical protein